VEDLIDALMHFMLNYNADKLKSFINIGYGKEITIKGLASLVKEVVGYEGEIRFNPDKPEGMSEKLLDTTKAKELGWESKTDLREGLKKTYEWFLENEQD